MDRVDGGGGGGGEGEVHNREGLEIDPVNLAHRSSALQLFPPKPLPLLAFLRPEGAALVLTGSFSIIAFRVNS